MTTTNNIGTMISSLTKSQQQEFAVRCARRVQHLMRDPRSIAVLDTRERWLAGSATDEEMRKAARAARAAADAAWAAAYDAERAWQRAELERMLKEARDE